MRLEWLEDILAVAETGSLADAAKRRGLTQSAFSRRIRLIEDRVGAELFDRARKPVRLRPTTQARRATIARLAGELHDLARDLREGADGSSRRIAIAGQHALTATRTSALIEAVRRADPRTRVELLPSNLDTCLGLLLARRADIAVLYREPGTDHPVRPDFVEVAVLGTDRLIPVHGTAGVSALRAGLERGEIAHVAYPPDVFFGALMARRILRPLRDIAAPVPLAQTALTIAALDMARAGIGVAWVPRALAAPGLADGSLQDLSDILPHTALEITAIRLDGAARGAVQGAWRAITGQAAG